MRHFHLKFIFYYIVYYLLLKAQLSKRRCKSLYNYNNYDYNASPSLCNTRLYASPIIALGQKLQEDSHSISKYCKLLSMINCLCILKQR